MRDDDPGEPLRHIVRVLPPWRVPAEGLTECGHPVTAVAALIDVDEVRKRVAKWGRRRTAFSVCMTCYDRTFGVNGASETRRWWDDPVGVLARDVSRAGHVPRLRQGYLADELRALGQLVEAHPEEWAELLEAVRGGDQLAQAREARRERRRGGPRE